MESGKKPSIFSDRGTIGSVGELDEYGVWVKSEPEDITFDDDAFLSGFNETVEAEEYGAPAEDGEAPGFDVDFASGEQVFGFGNGLCELDFDMNFGSGEPETPASEEMPEEEGGLPDFDMDFGSLSEAAPSGREVPEEAGDSAEEIGLPDFDMEFGSLSETAPSGGEVPEEAGVSAEDGGLSDFEISLDNIPDVPQTGAKTAVPPQGSTLQNDLLLKITYELSSIKAEINDLKKEISTIRSENTRTGGNDEPAVSPQDEPLSFDGLTGETSPDAPSAGSQPDEAPAVEFTLGEVSASDSPFDEIPAFEAPPDGEAASDSQPDEALAVEALPDEEPTSDSQFDEIPAFEALPDEEAVSDSPFDEIPAFEAPPDEEAVSDSPFDEIPAFEAPPDEEAVSDSPFDEVPAFEAPPDGEAVSDSPFDEIPAFEALPDGEPAADSQPDEAAVSVDLDLRSDEAQQDDGGGDFELTAYETTDEIVVPFAEALESAPDQLPVIPDYLSPDELAAINEAKSAAAPSAPVEADIPEAAPPLPPPAGPAAKMPPEQPLTQAAPKTAGTTPDNITVSSSFKKDLVVVLSYMDRLLEALPDEKIEEFARSEQFDVYKRLFTELGLA